MDDHLYSAFFPPSARVCGSNLRPFSLWHKFCLHAIGSPLLEYEEDLTPSDLLVAVRVCQTTWPEKPNLKIGVGDVINRWLLEKDRVRFTRACKVFVRFMMDHCVRPQFWESINDDRRELTGPPILLTVTNLTAHGIPLADAWNMPPGEAAWYESVFAEREGSEDRFLWEEDLQDDLPDLNEVDEASLYEQAVSDLGEAGARAWLQARQNNKKI